MKSNQTILIALGGNAILQARQKGTAEEQFANVQAACRQVAQLVNEGCRVVLVHGNGPQVGNILLQNEAASEEVPKMPLDICGAASQGMVGYMLQQSLQNELAALGIQTPVATVLTQVTVDVHDPAFGNPTKPIGPFYDPARARALQAEQGWSMVEDSGRGWRRVVPSPYPRRIVESPVIKGLLENGTIVIAGGGGGIPVVETPEGLRGVEAVIDKDLAGQRLAAEVGASLYMILTDVPKVAIHFGKPNQQNINVMTMAEARRYMAEGHFPAGSMLAKVQACVDFVQATGGEAMIAPLTGLAEAVAGRTGTRIVPGVKGRSA